jgi:hypothetical protein
MTSGDFHRSTQALADPNLPLLKPARVGNSQVMSPRDQLIAAA